MKNRTKNLLNAGKVAIGPQLRFGTPAIAEMFAKAECCDFIIIDGEHAPQTPTGVQMQIQAMGCTDVTPIARLPSADPDGIRVYLDMGTQGVFAPFINTAEQACLGAESMRYPPGGTRGYGPDRNSDYGLKTIDLDEENDGMLFVANIEHEDAIRNIDEILAVDGVDTFLVGPCDLSISLGVPLDFEHPKFQDAITTVLKAADNAKKPAGIGIYADPTDPDGPKRFVDMGFRMLLAGGEEFLLARGLSLIQKSFGAARKGA